jgi:hypothetical protein
MQRSAEDQRSQTQRAKQDLDELLRQEVYRLVRDSIEDSIATLYIS